MSAQRSSLKKVRNSYQVNGQAMYEGGSQDLNSGFQMYQSKTGLLRQNHFAMIRPMGRNLFKDNPNQAIFSQATSKRKIGE